MNKRSRWESEYTLTKYKNGKIHTSISTIQFEGKRKFLVNSSDWNGKVNFTEK
jgi:hypothetical protein